MLPMICRPQEHARLSASVGAAVIFLSACAFDATGLGGEAGSGEAGSGESTSTDATGSGGGSSTTEGTTDSSAGSESEGVSGTTSTGAETTSDPSTSGAPTSDPTDPSTSTGVEPCDSPMTVYPDGDDDGFGDADGALETCDPPPGYVDMAGDCDDGNGSVYPGADEVCDGVDNDCDLKVDEYSAANSGACNGCKTVVDQDRVYYFCPDEDEWSGAVAWCALRGAQLVSINSEAEFNLVWSQIKSQAGDFWVGADDMQKEGAYVWADGTPLSKGNPGWAQGEPMGDGVFTELDCVVLGGGWLSMTPGRFRTALCDPIIDPGWVCEAELEG
jgi:hypothetical protein